MLLNYFFRIRVLHDFRYKPTKTQKTSIITKTHSKISWFARGLATLALLGLFNCPAALAAPLPVNLASAGAFVVLAGAGITITGPERSTAITGDIGNYSTGTIAGLGSVALNGTNHDADTVTQTAKNDFIAAYNDAAGRSADHLLVAAFDLGGSTFEPGVYQGSTSLALTGTLILDATNNPNAVFIIQSGSTLGFAAASQVILTNGAQAGNVFWKVGTAATIGAACDIKGIMLATAAITVGAGVTVTGSIFSRDAAITLDHNAITRTVSTTAPSTTTAPTNTACHNMSSTSTAPPVMTLNGADPLTAYQNVAFTDPGATAKDSNSVFVTTNSTVDVSTVGNYYIQYIASDASGNFATNVRSVNVVALQPPSQLVGAVMPGAGGFQLTFIAAIGQPYRILSTVDVSEPQANWMVLASGNVATNPVIWSDPSAMTNTLRLYRVVSP